MKYIAALLSLPLAIGVAAAQTGAPLSPPGSADSSVAASPPNSDKGINAAPGIVHPANPDPGMAIKPPASGITPVVPPPGTDGNTQGVIPK